MNAGIAAIGQRQRGDYHAQATALSRGLTDAPSHFVEAFCATRRERGGREQAGVDGGLTCLVTPGIALDRPWRPDWRATDRTTRSGRA